jgi:beta-xylosidase
MAKKLCILLISLFTLSCSSTISAPPLPENFNEVSLAATQIANQINSTQSTPSPTDALAETGPLAKKVIFRDDFNVHLKSSWAWVNEDPNNWSLINKPGFLQINTTNGHFYLGNAKNVLLQPAPQDNFVVETSMLFDPSEGEQFAGLIILESNQNFIQVGLGYCPINIGCIQEGIYMDIYKNSQLILPRNAIAYNTGDAIFFRLAFEDGKITVTSSKDSLSWYRLFETETQMNIAQVGLITTQNSAEAKSDIATFDYFEISLLAP